MRIKFWGVRGSIPTPIQSEIISEKIIRALSLAKGVDLSDERAIKTFVDSLPLEIRGTVGGNTACVEVQAESVHLILDAGTGIRELGLALMKHECGQGRGVLHLFMSHTHWDHIQGFPFFPPALVKGNHILIYSPKEDIASKFKSQQVDQDMFPILLTDMNAKIEFIPLTGQEINLGKIKVRYKLMNHPGGCYSYRIEENGRVLVYATDAEYTGLDPAAYRACLDFFQNADVLIFDSQYTFIESVAKAGWGHSTSLKGVDMAIQAGVKRLVLFHHEPTNSDQELRNIITKTETYYELVRGASELDIILATEGLEIEI